MMIHEIADWLAPYKTVQSLRHTSETIAGLARLLKQYNEEPMLPKGMVVIDVLRSNVSLTKCMIHEMGGVLTCSIYFAHEFSQSDTEKLGQSITVIYFL